MKLHGILVSVCVSLCAVGAGCGGTSEDMSPATQAQHLPEQSPSEVVPPAEQSQGEAAEEGQVQQEGDMHKMARNCTVQCAAVNVSTGVACEAVYGTGSTTFLGGCNKACRFAREDAAVNAMKSSCRLTSCAETCR